MRHLNNVELSWWVTQDVLRITGQWLFWASFEAHMQWKPWERKEYMVSVYTPPLSNHPPVRTDRECFCTSLFLEMRHLFIVRLCLLVYLFFRYVRSLLQGDATWSGERSETERRPLRSSAQLFWWCHTTLDQEVQSVYDLWQDSLNTDLWPGGWTFGIQLVTGFKKQSDQCVGLNVENMFLLLQTWFITSLIGAELKWTLSAANPN